MNPKVRWSVWVDNVPEDNCPSQWFGQGHPTYIYATKEAALLKVKQYTEYFAMDKYSARKYVKRSTS